ncbi:MAG: hypothetical protein FJ012_04860 [Chloroflexi bacterium]|nr:hypothetical protein [Chloroflexota bacterium]
MRKWVFLLVALLLLLTPLMGACAEKKYELTISVSPGGTTSPAAGTHKYKKDATVTIAATANTGYVFDKWSGDASGTATTVTVTMTKDKSVRAEFKKIQYTLTIAVSPTGGGTVTANPTGPTYDAGTAVTLTATPASGYQFVNWTGDATGTSATVSVTMSANKTVTANFATTTYTLTMAKVGSGTVDPAVGAHTKNPGEVVNLTATPDTGWRFDKWTGDVTTVADVNDPTTTVTMNGNYTITANFIQQFTLTIAVNPAGGGTTNPAVGTYTKDAGTVVSITATKATGYDFVNWTGDVTSTNVTISVTMNANKSVTANFQALVMYDLTMAVDPAGGGTTTPAGTTSHLGGAVVTITANPASGWYFVQWTGDAADPNSPTTTVTMNANKTATAQFTQTKSTLNIYVDGQGSTTPVADTDHDFGNGRLVAITATPASGWKFVEWTGDIFTVEDSEAASTTILMDGDYAITAVFAELETFTLTLDVDPEDAGTTTPAVGQEYPYLEGTVVTVTATPKTGWQFVEWLGDIDTMANPDAATTTITMLGEYFIIASFEEYVGPTYPGVGSQWKYKVTYGTETTNWTLDVTAAEKVAEVTGESLGTGDGSKKVFGPVANIPILAKTEIVRVAGTIRGATAYTMDYGAGTVTFVTAPAAGQAVTIDYCTSAAGVTGVDCFKAVTSYSAPPARVASGYSVTISGSDTWKSQQNFAQMKAVAAITMFGSSTRTNMTDTYTGTPNFFTVNAQWSMVELGVLAPPAAPPYTSSYDVKVVGQESITVPAGTFNCHKVEYSLLGVVQKVEWWAPEVMGFVKQEDLKTYAQVQTMELTSVTLV